MSELHVVLGAGQIGSLLAHRLLERGHRVRQVRQGPAGEARPGLEWLSGDVADPAFAERAARGARVVYHCVNPPYHRRQRLLEPIARGILHGVRAADAKLVVLDNLYMYGRCERPFTEDGPMRPVSRKGELRARVARLYAEAHARGEARVTSGRASDFFGPGITLAAIFGERNYRRLLAGKPAEAFGDPDAPHAYSYGPDVAEALAVLGERAEADGEVWHLPAVPAEPTRKLLERLARALGVEPRVVRVPDAVLKVLGVFDPIVREVPEMTYQWKAPFLLDDSRFRRTFGQRPTPLADAVAATAEWARQHYGRPAGSSSTASRSRA